MQGTNIKAVRLKRGMSQQELADAIGVTKSTISKYEKGQREPKYNVLRGIAAALGSIGPTSFPQMNNARSLQSTS